MQATSQSSTSSSIKQIINQGLIPEKRRQAIASVRQRRLSTMMSTVMDQEERLSLGAPRYRPLSVSSNDIYSRS